MKVSSKAQKVANEASSIARALFMDFDELQSEVAEVSALLQQANENKLRLQAEVKFLKKRAIMLRASMKLNEPYFMRNSVGDGTQYVLGSSRPPLGRMVNMFSGSGYILPHGICGRSNVPKLVELLQVTDGELYAQAFSTQSINPFSRGPLNTIPSFKPQDIVGVLKTSSSKQTRNGNATVKKTGKRKISWQDEFAAKA